jgi:hypothetical protein
LLGSPSFVEKVGTRQGEKPNQKILNVGPIGNLLEKEDNQHMYELMQRVFLCSKLKKTLII